MGDLLSQFHPLLSVPLSQNIRAYMGIKQIPLKLLQIQNNSKQK